MHTQDGYRIDPQSGVVYGRTGKPIRRVNGRGYGEVVCNGRFYALIHRLVWVAANGPIPQGMQVNHINGIKTDNRIINLELVTPSGNTAHAYKLGLRRADGEFNGRSIGKRRKEFV